MKKVLIISFHYLPEVMAASYRMYAWAKYLPEFGWQPIILTKECDVTKSNYLRNNFNKPFREFDRNIQCIVYRVPYTQRFKKIWEARRKITLKKMPSKLETIVRRILNFIIGNFLMLPDERHDWFKHAYKSGLFIIKEEKTDVILSTGAPWTDFWVASRLCKVTGTPWLADYRDPWTQPTSLGIQKEYILRRFINRIWERKIIRTASEIIHISQPLQATLGNMIKRNVHHIPNGFDPENFENNHTYIPDDKVFTISFIGTLHNNTNTDVFIGGLHQFIRENEIGPQGCKVEFIGDLPGFEIITKSYPEFFQISKFFNFLPSVSQKEANMRMCKSHILLSFPLDMEGCCPAKTLEYLASGRPVLFSPAGKYQTVIKNLIKKTNGGVILNSSREVADFLNSKYKEFLATGKVLSKTKMSEVDKYSRKKQTGTLSKILDSTIYRE